MDAYNNATSMLVYSDVGMGDHIMYDIDDDSYIVVGNLCVNWAEYVQHW